MFTGCGKRGKRLGWRACRNNWEERLRGNLDTESTEFTEKEGGAGDSRGLREPNIENDSMDLDNCQGIL